MNEPTSNTIEGGHARVAIRTSRWSRYIVTITATFVTLLALYMGTLGGLHRAGILPPPPFVNELCADEKLEWLRDNPQTSPDLLVVGSSIAWRNVDSAEFVKSGAAARPLNGGFCHLQINQTEFATSYLLSHFPSVQTVAAIVVPQDFTDCAKVPAHIFDPDTANAYVFERKWPYQFYLKQFDLVSLVRNAFYIHSVQKAGGPANGLVVTAFGDGPVETGTHNGLVYGKLTPYEPSCFAALHSLAKMVTGSGRRFVVATSPINPAWSEKWDADGQVGRGVVSRINSALAGTGAEFWNGGQSFEDTPSDFTDAIHLQWSTARRYSAELAASLGPRQF